MKRKCLAVGIILLFVETSLIQFGVSEQICSNNIITVDDEPGDAQYSTIAEALLSASPGDIILVYSGNYPEWNLSIQVNNLTVEGIDHELGTGNDTGLPFVYSNIENNSPAIFSLRASYVVLSNFTIQNVAWYNGWSDVTIFADHCFITGCEFRGLIDTGVKVYNGFSEVSNNTFMNFGESINLRCNNTLVADNFIKNSGYAITVEGTSWYDVGNNTIMRNTVIAPVQSSVVLRRTKNITISYNNFTQGIYGINLDNMNTDVIITRNTLSNMSWGILVYGEFPKRVHHHIQENNFLNTSMLLSCYILTGHIELEKNFWSDYLGVGPKIIWGYKILFELFVMFGMIPILIRWAYVDWHPAQEPYDIPVMS